MTDQDLRERAVSGGLHLQTAVIARPVDWSPKEPDTGPCPEVEARRRSYADSQTAKALVSPQFDGEPELSPAHGVGIRNGPDSASDPAPATWDRPTLRADSPRNDIITRLPG
ncbi:hypothetical protein P1P68_26720, partial [Streptomyces scabiei]|uniref:hypothetical protein n=1 Tax=Streptomyces scabiei TaxID=1930 RepID=UPI0029905274